MGSILKSSGNYIEKQMDLTFGKEKHLCGKTTIARLYNEGRAFIVFPLRVVYITQPRVPDTNDNQATKATNRAIRPTVRLLVTAPKKRFHHAVDRNRYRRLLREAYRHHQTALIEALNAANITMDIAIAVVHNQLPTYADTESTIARIIERLIKYIGEQTNSRTQIGNPKRQEEAGEL